jgi:MoxR-like ATPase
VTASPTVPFEDAGGARLAEDIESLGQRLHAVRESIGRVIFGQQRVIDQTLITLLAGGHALVIGVPGLAKTRLMPADILGSEVLEESDSGRRAFRFIAGPVFCQLLMADEIKRASPRTQSALLQAMQEHRVTVAGEPHDLPRPFHVLATQNPLEQEGTYPLPEDRYRLPGPRCRAPHADRHHRHRRVRGGAGNDFRGADRGPTPGAPGAGRRERGR